MRTPRAHTAIRFPDFPPYQVGTSEVHFPPYQGGMSQVHFPPCQGGIKGGRSLSELSEKGAGPRLPGRPFGCCAQTGSGPFFASRPVRTAFSLLELMIAIMILGIGVVMVATVFPVGIEMTRQPIQAYLRLGIADTAAGTLKAKVPAYRALDLLSSGGSYSQIIAGSTPRVLVPNVGLTDIDADMGSSAEQQKDGEVVQGLFLNAIPPYARQAWYSYWGPDWTTGPEKLLCDQPVQDFISRTGVFTERTGWSAEVDISANHTGFNTASPVPAQNLPVVAAVADMNKIPVMVNPSIRGTYQTDLPRVSLLDQVYPPVTDKYSDGVTARPWGEVRADLLTRQYSWFAFHHRMSSESPSKSNNPPANRDILATIAVLHRADIGARFARQESLDTGGDYKVQFDFTNAAHIKAMLQPQADEKPETDAVFPRPWLVTIAQLNPQNGEAVVTPEVARLLPAGSFFIIARHNGGSNGYYAGTFIQVTRNEWNPTEKPLGGDMTQANFPWTRIEVARSSLPSAGNVAVWVFPPAITTFASPRSQADRYEFATRSPVVGVELRRIAVK